MDLDGKENTPGFYSPALVPACVSPENVNEIISTSGFNGDIDLLSIDIDGDDIHVWKAITDCSPRVLVIEVNNRLPFEQPYFAGSIGMKDPDKKTTVAYWRSAGSSLSLIVASAEARGYVFVGMNNNLINAFFVRKDAFKRSGLKAMKISDYLNHRFRPPESRIPVAQTEPQR